MWKERLGFARLAIEFGYPIVPFAAVGAEEMLRVLVDHQTPVAAQISAVMRRMVGVPLPPVARGIGPTVMPRPERLYFYFGSPVDTARYERAADDDTAAREVRDLVKHRVERQIAGLLALREQDPRRRLRPRATRAVRELLSPKS
jgi:1-acyl-sn-glycerol-3-phosphate acyltransferase